MIKVRVPAFPPKKPVYSTARSRKVINLDEQEDTPEPEPANEEYDEKQLKRMRKILPVEVDKDQVYGVRCYRRLEFGQEDYPAMGWQIRQHLETAFEWGAVPYYEGCNWYPRNKEYSFMKVSDQNLGKFIAVREWGTRPTDWKFRLTVESELSGKRIRFGPKMKANAELDKEEQALFKLVFKPKVKVQPSKESQFSAKLTKPKIKIKF